MIENLYLQRESGMLSERSWTSRKALVEGLILSPGFGMLIEGVHRKYFDGAFMGVRSWREGGQAVMSSARSDHSLPLDALAASSNALPRKENPMRMLILFLVFLTSITGCSHDSSERVESEAPSKAAVEETLHSFFEAISEYDYAALDDLTVDDFILVEDGEIWSLDDLADLMREYEGGMSIDYTLSELELTIEGDTAWGVYGNQGVLSAGDQLVTRDWTESAVFSKQGGEWRLALLHSTLNGRSTAPQGD